MSLFSRKRGEELDNGISATVTEMRWDRAKLGFAAPAEVLIHPRGIHPDGRFSTEEGDAIHRLVDGPTVAEIAMQRLRDSPYKVMRRVSCEYKHGVLFLRGRLFSFHEKQVAQRTVAGVGGVTQVVNEIEVDCPLDRS